MLQRRGETALTGPLREASIAELGDGALAEYYEPLTGAPLGSLDQSWTAAAALDLLIQRSGPGISAGLRDDQPCDRRLMIMRGWG